MVPKSKMGSENAEVLRVRLSNISDSDEMFTTEPVCSNDAVTGTLTSVPVLSLPVTVKFIDQLLASVGETV